jgi:DivIVA domain-containing protein
VRDGSSLLQAPAAARPFLVAASPADNILALCGNTFGVAAHREAREGRSANEGTPRSAEAAQEFDTPERPDSVPHEIRDVSFPVAVRGYERRAVDAYVQRVNRVIAELEVGSSPQAAVRHALDRVGEQTSGVLQRARAAAEEITATALAEAEKITSSARAEAEQGLEEVKLQSHQLRGRSKEEADQILAKAQAAAEERLRSAEEGARRVHQEADERLRALQSDADAVWNARRKLLDDLPRVATELMELAGAATARLQHPGPAGKSPAPSTLRRPSSDASEHRRPTSPPARPQAGTARSEQAPSEVAAAESATPPKAARRKSGSVSSTHA